MRTSILTYILVFLLALPGCFSADAHAGKKSDGAIVEMLDSLATAGYFSGSHYWRSNNRGDYGYPSAFIPQFDDQTYSERIARLNGSTSIPLTFNSHVRKYIRVYAVDKRKMTAKVLGLSRMYFPLFEKRLRQYNIPLEMKYLAIVESALNPEAVSSANAKGLWQFIYGTGKRYGLQSSAFVEDRFDPEKATHAAARHLRDLYNIYGDWFLVMAAYNAGPGNVNKAIRRSGGARDYWKIWSYLPRETRNYVPAFIAVTYVMTHNREHNIYPIDPIYLYDDIGSVKVSDILAFDQVNEVIGVPLQDLAYLNPQYKLGLVPAGKTNPYYLRLPKKYVGSFTRNEKEIYAHRTKQGLDGAALLAKARAVKTASPKRVRQDIHVVRRGETLASIARTYRCYVSQLIRWNNLKSSRIYPGQRLKIFGSPRSGGSIAWHKVRRGETLGSIARKYGMSVSRLKSLNRKKSSRIYPGQKLKVTGRAGSGGGSAARVSWHKVSRGETLGGIAGKYGMSVSRLKSLNKMTSSRIYPGQKLKVSGSAVSGGGSPSSVSWHKVSRGETLGGIAGKYGMSVSRLKSLNKMTSSRIYPGQKLKVSGSAVSGGGSPSAVSWHKVSRGETLGGIASKYGMSVSRLKSLNKMTSSRIYPGQKLKVSGNAVSGGGSSSAVSRHKVRRGETLVSIARKYGITVSKLKSLNNLRSSRIYPGQRLKVR